MIALAVERQTCGETMVTVLPVTHSARGNAAGTVEVYRAIKQHLGLDSDRSWIIVSEGDQFV